VEEKRREERGRGGKGKEAPPKCGAVGPAHVLHPTAADGEGQFSSQIFLGENFWTMFNH